MANRVRCIAVHRQTLVHIRYRYSISHKTQSFDFITLTAKAAYKLHRMQLLNTGKLLIKSRFSLFAMFDW